MKQSKSRVHGELKDEAGSTQSATPSSSEAKKQNISGTSGSSQIQAQSQVGFLPTKALGEPETTTNARLVVTFAAKLGSLVEWRKIQLADGREVFALCFPANVWGTNELGELEVKDEKR